MIENGNNVPYDTMVQCLIQVFKITQRDAEILISSKQFRSEQSGNAIWFGFIDPPLAEWKGKVISAYFHPTKQHIAITQGKLGKKQSVADPGQWAISFQSKQKQGNLISYSD
ncbi:hypothetical protein pb186bvf_002271 [Paramecium bursaria]